MTISTHVLDTSSGHPAGGLTVRLSHATGGTWRELRSAKTGADGRIAALLPPDADAPAGEYRLAFDVGAYFGGRRIETFYTVITVNFIVRDPAAHHHVPLLVSPYGYSTYRGS